MHDHFWRIRLFVLDLPSPLREYLFAHDIPPEIYDVQIPRFFRVHSPGRSVTLDDLRRDLGTTTVAPVVWAPGFYSCPAHVRLVGSALYQAGTVLGMDASSSLAAHALSLTPSDHVLDLCCAPGAKLVYLAQALHGTQSVPFEGTVTGVDVSKDRLATCRSLLKKHKIVNARLFCADGTTFSALAPVWGVAVLNKRTPPQVRQADVSSLRVFHAPQTLRANRPCLDPMALYDKVLVDAECTHDGSVAHILKYRDAATGQWRGVGKLWLDDQQLAGLESLQRRLLRNGWRLLKPGGILVYSTCSLSRRQNEAIVERFLDEALDARPDPIDVPVGLPDACRVEIAGVQNAALRMDPLRSQTSGLFVARLRKIAPDGYVLSCM
ncbi:hypothetical protein AMAG_12135 [Allomyces macrogynus ATCC 38327]|uniref:SAM-dependent MTase RsmB/NOP-type domain-containing protein n=1 Tax=Allomyces macrogynus (strain ATCC 38327) TaxID=578462 RepID=A0A0L0SXD7_ALLM3|nr:hypothetical protein AMAG_12135 [Allomyces macrogynus ATCC 38327]|eukprot:KNE67060.1 hypothetical protein AMAG_12135 [Allomyces macrogynus ATCC 38327]